ncbi:Ankyrin repeat and zinc finger domain-containing protein 1 [Clonorchis sinensis]|uniref:Ankyrin repeat and zinc finger domain-containing protein 1 n=1 Tax=Clonorchis sinensis TaxID=79923 RepID=A0A8T1LW65_CLOSI|nr:Ankyrin repeat and zinc finger domain-containing protein 1 [Clonorchis sinensis]
MTSKAGIVDRQCKRTCDRFSLFDQKIAVEKLTGLTLLAESVDSANSMLPAPLTSPTDPLYSNYVSSQDKFVCQICGVDLLDGSRMRKHFRTEWHLCNMNRIRTNQLTLSLADFNLINTTGPTELSSVQSELTDTAETDQLNSSSDPPPLTASSHKQMIYFRNKCGEIVGIHRCILFTPKRLPNTLDELLSCITRVRQSRRWAILLYSGGKFAGGIFDGTSEVVHKTLQHYTVRAKQGGGQASFDASNFGGMAGAKSAGASVRRHGEMAIRSDISNLLHNRWRAHLQACQFIFLWSPKVHRNIFFNPPDTVLDVSKESTGEGDPSSAPAPDPQAAAACQARLGMTADDPRIHRVPCRTKHITYSQVKEIHKELSTFDVYDEHANLEFLAQSERKQLRRLSESGDDTLVQTRSGRFILAPIQVLAARDSRSFSSPSELSDFDQASSSSDSPSEKMSESGKLSFEGQKSPAGRLEHGAKEAEEVADAQRKSFEELYSSYQAWHRRLRVAVASGDYSTVQTLLPPVHTLVEGAQFDLTTTDSTNPPSAAGRCLTTDSSIPPPDICLRLLNHSLAEGRTLLHVAVEFQSEPEVLNLLLESGCDPALLDSEGTSPYMLASRLHKKPLTNSFRRFRFFHPDRYDYVKAQIPAPLDPAKEKAKAERDRERLRKQRQRAKEKKAAERVELLRQKEEEAEKQRFMALSDREKRALVAERRILASKSDAAGNGPAQQQVFSRCFHCACDISGKVPFTYSDYNFCTPTCLRAHRLGSASK